MADRQYVFVYGTLMKGRAYNGRLDDALFVGKAQISGPFRFVNLGHFPGIVEMEGLPERSVGGEVYLADEHVLAGCDRLEGHPHFYERRLTRTDLGEVAWVYYLPKEYLDYNEIKDLYWSEPKHWRE